MAQSEWELVKAQPLKISTVDKNVAIHDQGTHGDYVQGGLTVASIENHAPVTTLHVDVKVNSLKYFVP